MNSEGSKFGRRRLAFLFSVPFAFSLAFFLLTIFSDRTEVRLQGVQNLSSCIGRLRTMASDIELGEHGFVLTSSEAYLIPLEQASANLSGQVRVCRQLARDQPKEMQEGLNELIDRIGDDERHASQVLSAFDQAGPAAALAILRANTESGLAYQVRRSVDGTESLLSNYQGRLLREQRLFNQWNYLFFVIGTGAMVFVMLRLYHAAVTYLASRDLLQQQLRDLNVALESEVEERTRDLQVANEELQQFAYVASHDLQEPLRTITSFTQLLNARYKSRLDEDADEFIGYIVTASRRMTDLINGLLSLARVRKAARPSEIVSFEEILADVEQDLGTKIAETSTVVTHSHVPSLVADRVQITQLFQNLISNAIKYKKTDQPAHIHISSTRDDAAWTISVADNGCGFDPQFAERIFGLFQRLPDRQVDGTGIGLAIARRIVERHGGRIWATSVEGTGSVFSFSLPVHLEAQAQTETESRPTLVTSQRGARKGQTAAFGKRA